ncbi:alpha/beta fold hydrolase [Enterobacteriaceae endosymbiont of Neohaemonia nigricornis]|uniref:alpha/beta fold hydrolase n=1 Tax=Enterobacteriaceae endosymbiont of Neohaemonia nigricornis TaxID=2675792 RepID=UPI001448E1C1|nr:alpha/beta fold hydrolase [Enterobacteriaceae endosymbiont of Neohaemonia nigricornis]QJC30491.1 alpha/beta fold hydrolase [Enterobacteriaceae endosymbiont of Neohaemonia nigricornis]
MILDQLIINNNNSNEFQQNIILLHGLFGNKNSLLSLGTFLNEHLNCKIILLDLRNHGCSAHHPNMNYIIMSQDILDTLNFLNIYKNIIIIGHSIGGKIAMFLTTILYNSISKIIVLDIAPVCYNYSFKNIFFALEQVYIKNIVIKKQVSEIMKLYIHNKYIINMLLQSFYKGKWNFNIFFIKKAYKHISSWKILKPWVGNILFLKGMKSNYINHIYYNDIFRQFPNAIIFNIPNAGHFLHVENIDSVYKRILNFCLQ